MYSNRAKNPLNQINTLVAIEAGDTQIEWETEIGTENETEREGGQRAAWQIMLKGIIVNIRGKCCNLNL